MTTSRSSISAEQHRRHTKTYQVSFVEKDGAQPEEKHARIHLECLQRHARRRFLRVDAEKQDQEGEHTANTPESKEERKVPITDQVVHKHHEDNKTGPQRDGRLVCGHPRPHFPERQENTEKHAHAIKHTNGNRKETERVSVGKQKKMAKDEVHTVIVKLQ